MASTAITRRVVLVEGHRDLLLVTDTIDGELQTSIVVKFNDYHDAIKDTEELTRRIANRRWMARDDRVELGHYEYAAVCPRTFYRMSPGNKKRRLREFSVKCPSEVIVID